MEFNVARLLQRSASLSKLLFSGHRKNSIVHQPFSHGRQLFIRSVNRFPKSANVGKSPNGVSEVPKKIKLYEVRRLIALAKPVRGKIAAGVVLLTISSGVTMSVPYLMGRIMDSFLISPAAPSAAGPSTSDEGLVHLNEFHSSNEFNSKSESNESPAPSILDQIRLFTDFSSPKNKDSKGSLMDDPEALMEKLGKFCLLLCGIFFVGAAANFGRSYLMIVAGQSVTNRLRTTVYSSILRKDIAFFDKSKTGELVNRLSNDVTTVGFSVTSNISDGLRSLAGASIGTGMMLYVSPKLSIIGLSIVPPVAICAIVFGRHIRKLIKQQQDALAAATQVAEERISAIRTVRAFARESMEEKRFSDKIDELMIIAKRDAKIRATFFGFTGLSGNAIILSILYGGGYFVMNGSMTIGQLSSFLLYAAYVGVSIGGLSGFYSELMRGLGASTRLFQLIDTKPSIPMTGGLKLLENGQFRGGIRFQGVGLAYPERPEAIVLNAVDLIVPEGKTTAVVGPSGSGKSTLLSLLLRLYDPTRGQIVLDGHDIRELDPTWLRQSIGTVNQDPVLFSCSIADNIAYGARDPSSVSEEDMITAAKQANAWTFIQNFPDGLNTVVGERGLMLSGGQRQRIAIARALVSNPKLLILDEATSALDAESEYQVRVALDQLLKSHQRTILVIAHRLSTVRNADQIAVLADGKIAELGTYNNLMNISDGIFKKLVEKQTLVSTDDV